ncbi:hypothetical protein [Actinomadura harenae]|uniref:Uncharacterized protein n=1 Tax=Actinomadura harenae TaxID=2483351 RepID=A0A3M2LGF3_9ACTN|nr:hypothetical protein [Actinomadura harenae]RMI36579.1 hypothetical protein EBO15_38285 [Actinomadura harenae]
MNGQPKDPVSRDAERFGTFAAAGGWTFGLLVARSVTRDEPTGDGKVPAKAFAERAGCGVARVDRHWRAWRAAADDGLVPDAATLAPGAETDLPEADLWPAYYAAPGSSGEKGQRVVAEAEAIGASHRKALEITGHRPAMRAAILGDRLTADAAREALLSRPEERAATISRALADPEARKVAKAEQRRADHLEYVSRVLDEGTARTPGGQVVALDLSPVVLADERLARVRGDEPGGEAVDDAYEFVRELVDRAVQADPDAFVREQRAKFARTLSATSRNILAIDPDDLLAVADETLVEHLAELQSRVNDLAATLRSVCV